MSKKKQIRKQRLQSATAELEMLQSELAFEQITVTLSDNDQHWRFKYGDKHLADYWPASGRGQAAGQRESVRCVSVSQAHKLAVCAKKRLFADIANALQVVEVASF